MENAYTKYKVNRPLDEWEIENHLLQYRPSSSKPWHELSLIRMNSTFLECVDKFYEEKGISVYIFAATIFIVFSEALFKPSAFISRWSNFLSIEEGIDILTILLALGPLFIGFWFFYQEGLKYTHYPIRFNRKTRKVHLFRRNGTVMTEDWDKLYFTLGDHGLLHREIRGHRLAEDRQTVLETFALPRHEGFSHPDLYDQWEFVRRYMEEGPEERDKLFRMVDALMPIADRRESFMHGFRRTHMLFKNRFLLLTLFLAICRWIVMHTARIPKWPEAVQADCRIEPDLPPRGDWKWVGIWNHGTNEPHAGKRPPPETLELPGQVPERSIESLTAEILFKKGLAQGEQGELDNELAIYEEVEHRFGQHTSPSVRKWIAQALINKGTILGEQGKLDAEFAIYEEIDRRFGQDESPDVREWVGMALINQGLMLMERGDIDAAIAVYEEAERRYRQDDFSDVRKWGNMAQRRKNEALRKRGKVKSQTPAPLPPRKEWRKGLGKNFEIETKVFIKILYFTGMAALLAFSYCTTLHN